MAVLTNAQKKSGFYCSLTLLCLLAACASKKKVADLPNGAPLSALESGFVHPPDTIQTSVYWYWMSDNISKAGVIKDLHAMKQVGINRAFIGNIGYPTTPYGKVKLFTPEWWDILHTALKTATELNIEIGIFNSPGWSQSGGPWIKPSQAMRYLTSSEVKVTGPAKISKKLVQPAAEFQDVRVIAFPVPKDDDKNIGALKPTIRAVPAIDNLASILDGNDATGIDFAQPTTIDLDTKSGFLIRSLTIYPAKRRMRFEVELQVKDGGTYRKVKSMVVDRSNDELNVGFDRYAPAAIAIPATTANNIRLVFRNLSPHSGITDIKISSSPKVEQYAEKTLAKMYPTPLPYWNEYQWKQQPVINDPQVVIAPNSVIDISQYMSADGTLNWNAPAGEWKIMRTGMTPTKVTNAPASPEGTGLEVDKMSKKHVAAHFDAFLGEIMRRIPAVDRKTWKITVEDSYETGGQNWTDELIERFAKVYGYSPLPYLPVLQGNVVGSADMSDRFLWDLRRLIADKVAYDYVGGLRDVSHKHGLTTWLENYGHWGFPGEFLQYGGQSDEVAGEFWSEGELGNIENRAASSAAHIYGKTKVSAESFTAGGKSYARYPALMKQRGDRFFTEGINNTLLHLFIQQPDEDRLPGINANFGNEFNRHNTWYNFMDLFTSYLKRSNLLLQQGKYVADVAYFIGEDAPKMTGVCDPALPFGYAFDYINAEVIRERVQVKDGKLVLPDGMTYSLLVLPQLETMRPELLLKIRDLVAAGATILGPAPKRSPSMEGFPQADNQVRKIAAEIWGKVDGKSVKSGKFGKGMVLSGMDMQTALNSLQVGPDLKLDETTPVLYIHRTTADGEIYFVSNQSEQELSISPAFRIKGKQPELWDAVTGEMRNLPEYAANESGTVVPLKLAPLQSAFVLFRKPAGQLTFTVKNNFPDHQRVATIAGPWQVSFEAGKRGPEKVVSFPELIDWTQSADDRIKYFSGSAIYRNTFKAAKPAVKEHVYLHLGDVMVMAKVKVNGVYCGGVWTAPWQVDITHAVKPGNNTVEIEVVNNWINRLIGDSKLPEQERKTWTSNNEYNANSTLQSSGLKGPVTLNVVKID
jgi:hypothetical protein